MSQTILVHLATGFEEIEAITIIDVLRRAGLDVRTVSVTGNLMVTGAHQINIEADQLFDDSAYKNAAMLILPGGMPGTTNLMSHAGLALQLKNFHDQKKWIGAICAAPMILGSLGILKGKSAVCYPGFEGKLTDAEVRQTPYAVDGNVITGRGVGTALEFSIEIVRRLVGEKEANDLATALVMP